MKKKLINAALAISMSSSISLASDELIGFTLEVSTIATIFELVEKTIALTSIATSFTTLDADERRRRDKRKRLEESIEVYNSTKEITPDLKEHISVIRRDADDNQFKDIQEMTDAQLAYAINEALKYQPEAISAT